MSDKPVFIYAATYADRELVWTDYWLLRKLHSEKLIGTYDVAVVNKDADGKVHVQKREKPTEHAAWGGVAVGALVGVLFTPLVIGAAAVGGAVGAIGGHLRSGLSRADLKELGELLNTGEAALIVIAESRVKDQLDKALTNAERSIEKELDVDSNEFAQTLEQAGKELVQ
jgi:uncharacterized membrane protein